MFLEGEAEIGTGKEGDRGVRKVTGEELVEGQDKGCWWGERITGMGEDY